MGRDKLICPKCSNNIDDDSSFCSFCGNNIKRDTELKVSKDINTTQDNTTNTSSNNTNGGNYFVLGVIIAILSCALFFISAEQISEAAEHMMDIRSVSGESVAEIYYQDVGKALKGFAMFCRALGAGILALPMIISSKHRNN